MFGRYRQSGRLNDLMLVAALSLIAANNLLFLTVPAVSGGGAAFSTWAPVGGGLLGALTLACSAYAPWRRLRRPGRAAVVTLALCAGGLVAIGATVLALGETLPVGLDRRVAPDVRDPHLVGHWALLAAQLAGAVLFVVAAAGFARRAERTRDSLMVWLGSAAVLAAAARVNYFLFPSLYSEWVYTGDFFRLGFYLLLLAGAGLEIRAYWRRLAEAARREERRRVARDLHDGVIQELALIEVQARELAGAGADPVADDLAAAAERALDESRRAVAARARSPSRTATSGSRSR